MMNYVLTVLLGLDQLINAIFFADFGQRLLPSAAGRSMEQELTHLNKALGDPERPVMAVIGGAKVSTKIALLENLVKRVETLVIGGAMANTFLAAEGFAVAGLRVTAFVGAGVSSSSDC